MSFDNSSSFAHWQSSVVSASENTPQSRTARGPQSVWGQPTSHAGTRRGLTPLATSNVSLISDVGQRRPTSSNSQSAQNSAISPGSANFPSLLSANRGGGSRQLSSTSSLSAFPPLQSGGQQHTSQSNQSITSPRSRTITPLSHLVGTSSTNTYSQGGPGGGGGGGIPGTRGASYSPSPTGHSIIPPGYSGSERSANAPLSAGSGGSGSASLTKITVAQVLLLVDTITEREGKAKWEQKADQIRKLVDSNGMEVQSKYLARLVSRNSSQIFAAAKPTDGGSYDLLRENVESVAHDLARPWMLSESIETADGDTFRDFDLARFIEHFQLDAVSETVLIIAFRTSSRADLRQKAEAYLEKVYPRLPQSIQKIENRTVTDTVLATLIESLATNPPRNFGLSQKQELVWAIGERYQSLDIPVPREVAAAVQLLKLSEDGISFLRRLQRLGPKATSSQDAAGDLLASMGLDKLNEVEVAHALLFMSLSIHADHFRPDHLISAIRGKSRVKKLAWSNVVAAFDIPSLQVNASTFLRLFRALQPLSSDEQDFDLQSLWGGIWQNSDTQISFVKAFLQCSDSEIEPIKVPNFTYGFSSDAFEGRLKEEAKKLLKSHVASLPALSAVFDIALDSEVSMTNPDCQEVLQYLLDDQQRMSTFVLSSLSFPTPYNNWSDTQSRFLSQCFGAFLQSSQNPKHAFVLEALHKQSPEFVFNQCYSIFQHDPMTTELILSRCEDLDWTENFLQHWGNPLAIDLACLRHRNDANFDMDRYLQDVAENLPRSEKTDVGMILNKFIRIKAEDELRTQRRDQPDPRSVPLTLKTVFSLLCFLEDHSSRPDALAPTQRACLQAYPRLINYGEGYDDILDKSHEELGNKLPEEVDRRMSDLFGQMYRNELKIREVVELMKKFKTSQNPGDQDLFCCVVHGLFEEYSCLHEYPDDALETTAVLFGSIINYRLVSSISLQVALALILDAVQNFSVQQSMFKFGVEALEQLRDRLSEWPSFCALLTEVPTLQDTDILEQAQGILRERGHDGDVAKDGLNGIGDPSAMTNGALEDYLHPENAARAFRALYAEPPVKGRFADPDPASQEKILFVINNTSNDNLSAKVKDLGDVLNAEHYQWFAAYLVEQRARLEPNNQDMYVRLLNTLDDRSLQGEVLRETYSCTVKMMNADATMNSAQERGHLKNLGGWLGSLTIAKDRPIKHRNIYFTDLLLEGHFTERLAVVIPFTCKVLVQGARSTVFKPPNPWLMEIVGLLMELYDNVIDLKLNLKFEIEVLCKDIGLDHRKIERTTILQDQAHQFDDSLTNVSAQADGLEMFDELPLNGMNRGVRQRLSTETVMVKLQSLADQLKYPPPTSAGIEYETLKTIIYQAFERAINEIINPVVERSITIASISTGQLISKDYACEVDEDKYRSAARQMVKSLAGNLALVTCKEPLRMSITNYIRNPPGRAFHDQLMPEGTVLMCVNDNLDLACSLIAESAEENSITEIDTIIETEFEDRRRHLAQFPDRPFVHHSIPRWAQLIPEPYKQNQGGLNEVQQAVYDGFDRTLHGVGSGHTQNVSTDSTRQVPDVLQDSIAIANLSTPAEQPALPHQPSQPQDESRSTMPAPRVNGFSSNVPPQERLSSLLISIQRAARSSTSRRLKDLEPGNSVFGDVRQLLMVVSQSARPPPELLARQLAETIGSSLFAEPKSQLEADVMTVILRKLCEVSELTSRDVYRWLALQEDTIINNVPVTVALADNGLLDFARIDAIIGRALQQRSEVALRLLAGLMDETLFIEEPLALRADFSSSLEVMNQWLGETPNLPPAIEIDKKLRQRGMPQFVEAALSDKARAQQDQMSYTFREWIKLYQNAAGGDRAYASFLRDLHQKQLINSEEDSAHFIRICIDICIEGFEYEARSSNASLDGAYLRTDSLARLIILLVKLRGESNGAVKMQKAPYLAAIMSIVVLVQNHHQVTKGDRINQRVFFRLYSSLLYEYATNDLAQNDDNKDMMLAFAETFLVLQPAHFPSFAFHWLNLISHRVFVAGLMTLQDEAGWEPYSKLLGIMLSYVTATMNDGRSRSIAVELYRGTLKILLMVYHDFADFLCENHYQLCGPLPSKCTQIRNLILSAYPQSYQELPDPTNPMAKVERLEEMKRSPMLSGDVYEPLVQHELKEVLEAGLRKGADMDGSVRRVVEIVQSISGIEASPETVSQTELLESLMLYVCTEALNGSGRFDAMSVHGQYLSKLVQDLSEEATYAMMNALFDQVRYPNTHTNFFSKFILHLFGTEQAGRIREVIVRVLLERLITHRPHPWGLAILFLELDRNPSYGLWEMSSLVAAPPLRQLLMATVRS